MRVLPSYTGLASVYDQTLGHRSLARTRRAFEHLIRRYGIGFRSAADLGCGTGLFARYLSERWCVPVYGVDRSIEMLRVAFRNCRGPMVTLLHQDMRRLSLPRKVDLVTANFDTVNHLRDANDLGRAFRRAAENLRPGGWFLFDVLTTCGPLAGTGRCLRRFLTHRGTVEQRIMWSGMSRAIWTVVIQSVSTLRPREVELHRERTFLPQEIGRALLDAGFSIRGVHDAVTLEPAVSCPPRLLVVAQKPTCSLTHAAATIAGNRHPAG